MSDRYEDMKKQIVQNPPCNFMNTALRTVWNREPPESH